MTIEEQRLRNLFRRRAATTSGWVDVFPAIIGRADGVILSPIPGVIYVRHVLNGQVYEVYNDGAPTDSAGLQIEVGRLIGEYIWRVKGVRNTYDLPANPGEALQVLLQELFIGRDRFLPFLVFPIAGGEFLVNIYGDVFIKGDGTFGYVANQSLDLASYVPADGAKFVLIEADEDGVIYVNEGVEVDSKELLTPADIPAVTSGRIPSTAVRLYTGQTQLYRDPNTINDFVDVRNITAGGGGGASLPTLDPLRVVVTDASGNIIADADFYYDETDNVLVLGGFPFIPGSGWQNSFHIVGDGVSPSLVMTAYGADIAPFITGFKADGTAASPTNVKADQVVFRIMRARGYDGSDWTDSQGEIRVVADADWSPGDTPVRLEFYTTPIGSGTQVLALTINGDGGVTFPILTADPSAPMDGEMWLLRESAGAHADGEAMGPLGLTYTDDVGIASALQLSVNDNGTTRRLQFA